MKIEDLNEIDGQISLEDLLREQETPLYGYRGCKGCTWYRTDKEGKRRCYWAITRDRAYRPKQDFIYPNCENSWGHFEPSAYYIPRMCANCKYANHFCYKEKPEYNNEAARRTTKAMRDPVEEPNIYCTHRDGSLNRRTEYKDLEWADFGVGHWDRQHEWDTCDRWELDTGNYRTFDFTEEQMQK